MPIEICAVGGYNEVGKNCTAINIDGEVVICDMGVYLDNYIKFAEDDDVVIKSANELIKAGAIPDINKIKEWTNGVKAIIPTHAHLDHVGALPYLAERFEDAEILGTPYTISVLNAILKDEDMNIPNHIKSLSPNAQYQLTGKIKIEFIHMTHSTPQTVMVAIHTKYGIVLYANDFKFDSTPVLGKKPHFERLKEFGKKGGIFALICDSTYADLSAKTPSEAVAKEMLKEVLLGTESKDKAVIITTFSSHLARLKSIIELGKKMNRSVVLMGRSLSKYVFAGQDIKLINFGKDAKILRFKKQIDAKLADVNRNKGKYLLVVTGHQGEQKAVLSKMVRGAYPFKFGAEDQVIFSSSVIPTELNKKNREHLENALKGHDVRIFRDVHVSGHAAREDLRDLINMVKPKYIIPAHGNEAKRNALGELAEEMGYKKGNVHLLKNGSKIVL